MTVQTVKLGGRRFVIIAEKDFRKLKANAARPSVKPRNRRRLNVQDQGDIAEAAAVSVSRQCRSKLC